MKTLSSIKSIRSFSNKAILCGKKIGFVPTMGALHQGHLELIKAAKKISDIVVVSIFVNPLQFGPKEDFKKYPRNIINDKYLLLKAGVDILFLPNAEEMFLPGHDTYVEVPGLFKKLCGGFRPGHFKGVATVVSKLFNIVMPVYAFFGEKDFQQLAIIKKMTSDLNLDVVIKSVPTVREKDGLAMSSRNAYLSKEERACAPILYESLLLAGSIIKKGQKDSKKIKSEIIRNISRYSQFKIQYISICDPTTLEEIKTVKYPALIAIAVYLGKTRLIDNIVIIR